MSGVDQSGSSILSCHTFQSRVVISKSPLWHLVAQRGCWKLSKSLTNGRASQPASRDCGNVQLLGVLALYDKLQLASRDVSGTH